jgi:hypothetical protein
MALVGVMMGPLGWAAGPFLGTWVVNGLGVASHGRDPEEE